MRFAMLFFFVLVILTISTLNSLWYFYFVIELLWFAMLFVLFDTSFLFSCASSSQSNLLSYFSFVVFNAMIGIMLLICLSTSSFYGFLLVFLGKFGLLPLFSLVLNYISYVSLSFLINYLFLKLAYFLIFLLVINQIPCNCLYRELIVLLLLASLFVLFGIAVGSVLVAFNLYSLVSSTFNYLLLLLLYTLSFNTLFPLLYILLYSYNSLVLYVAIYMFFIVSSVSPAFPAPLLSSSSSSSAVLLLASSLLLSDLLSLSAFLYICYFSVFVYMLVLSGIAPLFVFFLKLFFLFYVSSVSLSLLFALSFVVFFLFAFAFLNIILYSA